MPTFADRMKRDSPSAVASVVANRASKVRLLARSESRQEHKLARSFANALVNDVLEYIAAGRHKNNGSFAREIAALAIRARNAANESEDAQ
jgi:hypothetical protein